MLQNSRERVCSTDTRHIIRANTRYIYTYLYTHGHNTHNNNNGLPQRRRNLGCEPLQRYKPDTLLLCTPRTYVYNTDGTLRAYAIYFMRSECVCGIIAAHWHRYYNNDIRVVVVVRLNLDTSRREPYDKRQLFEYRIYNVTRKQITPRARRNTRTHTHVLVYSDTHTHALKTENTIEHHMVIQ